MRLRPSIFILPVLLLALALSISARLSPRQAAPPPARTPSAAGSRVECGALPSKLLGRSVRFCAVLPPSYDAHPDQRFPVLYWLHGLGENEQSFVGTSALALLEDLREQGRLGEFLLITPDAGRSFYLNSRDGRTRYEDFFMREFLPAMERRFRTEASRATRGISGVSMGGFGALHFGLKYPKSFGSVSAHSAALMEKPPEAVTNAAHHGFFEDVFGWPLDLAFWDRNSVFAAARHAPLDESWNIYFDCGAEDDFGFDQGNQALDRLLTSRGIRHEFHLYPGRHGGGYFAKHLPASLEFHWKVFREELKGRQ